MTTYICLEGGEGTYKTTTAKALAEHYRSKGL
jgi:thymidylate kinase